MRTALILLGLVALGVAWLGPLPALAHRAFFGHMTMHMMVVAIAAPLLALGIAGSRFDPVVKAPALFAPIPASVLELILVWGWHAPLLHHFARGTLVGLVAEQSTFLMAGLLVWISAFGGPVPRRPARAAAGIIGLLLTSMHMTLLGALLALTPRPLYHGEGSGHSHGPGVAGMTALEDQHLGGAVMLVVGGIAYLTGGLWLTVDLVRTRLRTQEELS